MGATEISELSEEADLPACIDPNACDACRGRSEPECQRTCPADIVHLDPMTGKAGIIEPDFCWECFACVKACPQSAIGVRGAADVMPLGARAVPRRGAAAIGWTVTFRNGDAKAFQFPIRTTLWGSIEPFAGIAPASIGGLRSNQLCGERPAQTAARAQAAAAH